MFERLTVYIDGEAREDHSRDTGKWKNGSRECMALLAAYEDTGLTPDEIAALRAENGRLTAEREFVLRLSDAGLVLWRNQAVAALEQDSCMDGREGAEHEH